jgi:hypothetical protein
MPMLKMLPLPLLALSACYLRPVDLSDTAGTGLTEAGGGENSNFGMGSTERGVVEDGAFTL